MRKNQTQVFCDICDKEFSKCRSAVKRTKHDYCSIFCYRKAKHTEEHKNKIREGVKRNLPKTAYKKGNIPWTKGRVRHEMLGEKHPLWKGGRTRHNFGYIYIHSPDHPFRDCNNRVLEHRLVMEKNLGRYLSKNEVVHHMNHVKDDNRIDNLMLISTNSEHIKLHSRKRNKKGQFTPCKFQIMKKQVL